MSHQSKTEWQRMLAEEKAYWAVWGKPHLARPAPGWASLKTFLQTLRGRV